MRHVDAVLGSSAGWFLLLLIAAMLEVSGDAFFQTFVHRSSGTARFLAALGGVATLSAYGILVNLPRWNFGRLLGIYLVFFFLAAQGVGKIRFHEPITLPIVAGGILIAAGGAIITFWNR